jgi:poly-gamma-glutamate hydrolase-like protein
MKVTMADRYKNFLELAKKETQGIDFRVRLQQRAGKAVVLAPHGGGIEPGTSEIAEAIAGADLSFYAFEGVKPADNRILHITSAGFDEPQGKVLAEASLTVIAVHGEESAEEIVFLGGLDEERQKKFRDSLISAQKPSKLPDGSWNPPVKGDLEARLRRGHIDLAESFPWNLRGPRTRIERKRPPEVFTKAEWARWNVRDGEMKVIDAIDYASFLRSKIAAHKSDPKMVRVLSIYDVANVQLLARRLILETMGFWRFERKAPAPHQ